MTIELFCLCDAATDNHGKLNILGVFDAIWLKEIPAKYPQCTVALRLRFKKIECGKHTVAVNFIDMDGKPLIQPARGEIAIACPEGQRSATANMILNIQQMQIAGFGTYSIDLAVDGRNVASLPLHVFEKK